MVGGRYLRYGGTRREMAFGKSRASLLPRILLTLCGLHQRLIIETPQGHGKIIRTMYADYSTFIILDK